VFCAESDNVGSLTERWAEATGMYQYLYTPHKVLVVVVEIPNVPALKALAEY
jgi:hypothetical protein